MRSSLAAAGLAVCLVFSLTAEVGAWPRPVQPAKPKPAAPQQQADGPDEPAIHLNTLAEYTTQELNLPLDNARRPFEAAITVDGDVKVLELQPYSMRSPDFQVLMQDATGALVPAEVQPPQTYRGWVRGEAGSLVAASLIDGQLWATVDLPARGVWNVQPLEEMVPGAPALRSSHVVYKSEDVLPVDRAVRCGVEVVGDVGNGEAPQGGIAGTGYEVIEIGCDADFEYFQLNGSSVLNTVNDIENLLNSVEFIFERDVDLAFETTVIIVRTDVNDPYTANGASSLLNQFASTWNTSPENGIRRDVGHMFTGREITGGTIGIAVTPSTCFTSSAYSLVQSRYTSSFTLRQSLSAHELGHTLSALHCDGNGDCHIMCSGNGGCDGVFGGGNLRFGFAAVSQITGYANSGNGNCLAGLPDPVPVPFFDDFESLGVPDPVKWVYIDGGIVSTAGVNEPSGTRALNLDATGSQLYADDDVRTNFIPIVGQTNIVVAYYTQHRGVEAGETLTVEYWGNNLRWTQLAQIVSDGVDQNQFDYRQHPLPANGYWAEFRLRFRTDGSSSDDDWYIDNVFVGPDPGLVFGACCLSDFSCIDSVTEDSCVNASGGTWQGEDSTCAGVDCTPPLGACCFSDQSCAPDTTQHGCEVIAGGTWQGEGVPCDVGQCDPPSGTCCLTDGNCVDGVTETLCTSAFGGTYMGDGTLCSGTNCPQPIGACCTANGDCVSGVTEDACVNSLGGVYQGDDVECVDVSCPQPIGACCASDGGCFADMSEDDCVNTMGGTYQGDGSVCESVECPIETVCPADMVSNTTFQPPGDGTVDGADLAYMLGEWGANPGSLADIVDNTTFQPPPDGVVDGADLAYMLGEWGVCK